MRRGVWRWVGLFWGTVIGFFLVLGLPDPPAHRHAHTWALAVGIQLGVQQLFYMLGLIADCVEGRKP